MELDSVGARALVETLIPRWQHNALGPEAETAPWQVCSHLAVLFFAYGHDLFDDWPEWIRHWRDAMSPTLSLDDCQTRLIDVALARPSATLLQALLDAFKGESDNIEFYQRLTRTVLRRDHEFTDQKLAVLRAHLHETGRWESLPPPYPAMLEGRVGLEALRMTCQAPSDWNPDDISEELADEASD